MKISYFRKGLFCIVIILFIGAALIPSIGSNDPVFENTIYVDNAYLSWYDATHVKNIQEGLNNAPADAINSNDLHNTPTWKQINQDGFGTRTNVASRGLETFSNYLIIGTRNLYITNSNLPIWKRSRSNGCEIWCYDGKEMKQLVGNGTEAKMKAGFGNKNNSQCLVLKEFNGSLYCGVLNIKAGCQIWRTKDINETWEMAAEKGFGNKNNIGAGAAIIFNGYLYIGTGNFVDGGEVYRTNDGENWEVVVGKNSATPSGFGAKFNSYMWSMTTYNSWLYVGTMNLFGCELWKSCNGVSWYPVIAYKNIKRAKLNGADFPRGFGKRFEHIIGVREMAVFNDELYLGLAGLDVYVNLTMPHIGNMIFVVSRPPLIDLRRFIPSVAQVWKYNASNDKWTRIVGGKGERNDSAGFGDPLNNRVYAMEIFSDYLHVGTSHPEPTNVTLIKRNSFLNWNISIETFHGQAEIWRYNGKYWEQIHPPDEFSDGYNFGIQKMKVYNNSLIFSTFNLHTGSELWEYSLE